MDLGLKGKVAIVTGGAQGIGRATVLTFAGEGAKIAIGDLDKPKANAVASEVKALGSEALVVKMDVSNLDDAHRLAKATLDRFGQIDILANVAGVWFTKSFLQTSKEEWDQEIGVCLYGVLNCCRAVLPHMIERRGGKIVNVASDAGRVGEVSQPVYSAAKAGVIGITKVLAKDMARHGILVNAVSPAGTRTEGMIHMEQEAEARGEGAAFQEFMKKSLRVYPLRKWGTPQDVASMIVFLASQQTNHVTGQTISVNGGFCMI